MLWGDCCMCFCFVTSDVYIDIEKKANKQKLLINRLIKQGGNYKEIKKTLIKVFGRHFQSLGKFCDKAMSFADFVM